MKTFALADKPSDYSQRSLFEELLRLPQAFSWGQPELILLRLCPIALRLAHQANWPLIRECWRQAYGIHPLCQVRLEAKCP